ncbi:MAG: hypothetical protein ABIN36_11200 [Ferruginibacter sp.]
MKKYFLFIICISLAGHTDAQLPGGAKKSTGIVPVPRTKLDVPATRAISSETKTIRVTPLPLRNLCPWERSSGDNNFEDHAVSVVVNISYGEHTTAKESVVIANISLSGEESGGDRTMVKGSWKKTIYSAPAGWTIKSISNGSSSLASYFSFTASPTEPYSTKACHVRSYKLSRNNLGYAVTSPTLSDFEIIVHVDKQDDFDEVESTCGCGFQIEMAAFKPLTIVLERK